MVTWRRQIDIVVTVAFRCDFNAEYNKIMCRRIPSLGRIMLYIRSDHSCSRISSLHLNNSVRGLGTSEGPLGGDGRRRQQRLNRLLYHSKQRGWLELDIILGKWAEKNLEQLSPERLDDFEELLGIENPDMFKYLTGQIEPEEELRRNPVFEMIRKNVHERMEEHSVVAKSGGEWVRGWNDGQSS